MMKIPIKKENTSPFGGKGSIIDRIHVSELARRYRNKCNLDISSIFQFIEYAELYQCDKTGYKYWLPDELAGDQNFYKEISSHWPNYYKKSRWEYKHCLDEVRKEDFCLEIGCGKGYFLKKIENICLDVIGLEFNQEAIDTKVCNAKILNQDIKNYVTDSNKFDKIFSFQVLEHITTPLNFLKSCLDCLKPGGTLIVSTPNDDNFIHKNMQDPFNLPPHHMGCYNKDIFIKISQILNISIVNIRLEPPNFPEINVTDQTKSSIAWRIFYKFTKKVGLPVLKKLGEPGHTILVMFKKPHT